MDLLIQTFGLEKANTMAPSRLTSRNLRSDQQMLQARSPLLDKSDEVTHQSHGWHTWRKLARATVTRTEAKLADLKRLIRYLKRYPDMAQAFSSHQSLNETADTSGCRPWQ